jgi:hypothetical protein
LVLKLLQTGDELPGKSLAHEGFGERNRRKRGSARAGGYARRNTAKLRRRTTTRPDSYSWKSISNRRIFDGGSEKGGATARTARATGSFLLVF